MKFICFGSGSSGNCYYLESRGTAILIDLGIGIRAFKRYMSNYGLTIPKIAAIIVTHDHTDHIKAVGPMAITYRTPVYASQRVHEGIDRNRFMTKKIPAELRVLTELNTPFEVGNFRITPFAVPHDSSDNNGYFIELIQAEPGEDKMFGSLFGSVDTAPISIGESPKNIGDSQKNVGDFPKNVGDFSKNVGVFLRYLRRYLYPTYSPSATILHFAKRYCCRRQWFSFEAGLVSLSDNGFCPAEQAHS